MNIAKTLSCTMKCLVHSLLVLQGTFLTDDFGPRRLCLACLVTVNSADRWSLSTAVNRPLVGELTHVTLLLCNSRVPSHSLGQLMSFSQKCDEQVVAVQLGCGRMCSP